MQVGYVGLGNMGGALAARLQLSWPLVVYDPSEQAREALAARGARAAESLAALAEACDVVFLCLPTSKEVRAVLDGGLTNALRPGSVVVDQTTGDPGVTRALAAELASRGIGLVDAPVSGGRQGAEAGTIAIMVGAGEEAYARILPVLQSISPNVFHAGGVGAGHVVKLVNNLLSMSQRLLCFEGVALAAKNGVDPARLVEILSAGGARSAYLERMLGPRVLKGKLDVGFTLGLAHKDVRLACALGEQSGVPMFFGNLARELYQVAIGAMGRDNQVDTSGLVFERLSGARFIPDNHDLAHAVPPPQGSKAG